MFGVSSVVTPSAATNLQAVEVYKSDLSVNGLSGAADGIVGSVFSSFQHQLRLRPIAAGGTGRFTNVFGFYSPPARHRGRGMERQQLCVPACRAAGRERARS